MSNVYRLEVPKYDPQKERRKGPYDVCPACGSNFKVTATCPKCRKDRDCQAYQMEGWICAGHEKDVKESERKLIQVSRKDVITCIPSKRIRISGWWIFSKKCKEPGTHIHQYCECGWTEIMDLK